MMLSQSSNSDTIAVYPNKTATKLQKRMEKKCKWYYCRNSFYLKAFGIKATNSNS